MKGARLGGGALSQLPSRQGGVQSWCIRKRRAGTEEVGVKRMVAFPGLLWRFCLQVGCYYYMGMGGKGNEGSRGDSVFPLQVCRGFILVHVTRAGGINQGYGTGLLWYAMHIIVPVGDGDMGFLFYYLGTRGAIVASPFWRSTWVIIHSRQRQECHFQHSVLTRNSWTCDCCAPSPAKMRNPARGAAQRCIASPPSGTCSVCKASTPAMLNLAST